jgi:phosphate acyltransferase
VTATIRVALDAMGGDHAPAAMVDGARRAAEDHGVDVVLVGDPERLGDATVPVVAASQWITMDEDPAIALRSKPDASVRVAASLVADGEASAFVSAGNTGATLAAALLGIGRVSGVRRPVIAAALPTPAAHGTVLVDAGASADVQPEALVSYARMGVAYARVLGTDEPRVGLLNVGAESGKGNALTRDAEEALSEQAWFAGNVEPPAVLAGEVDVVVTDGFTGNIFLKTVEAAGGADADGPGAAVLLGVAGTVLVAHGASRGAEVAAALRTAADAARADLGERVAEVLAS